MISLYLEEFNAEKIILRVDANGGFQPNETMKKLQQLADLQIHSIEQPIATGQWQEIAKLCAESPIPIALDEELIGIHELSEKEKLWNDFERE